MTIFLSTTGAFAESEFLMKSTADAKYQELISCITSKNNDSSLCMNEYVAYFKAEIALIKTFPEKKDEYGTRLDKTVEYLKKSTEIYYKKARENNDLAYYEKASRCAELLIKLSDKYRDYQNIIDAHEKAKHGKVASDTLGALFRKVKSLDYPSNAYIACFLPLMEKSSSNFNSLDETFKTQLFQLGQDVTDRFIRHLSTIEKDLSGGKNPDYSMIGNKYKIYQAACRIPGVSERNGGIISLRKSIGILIQNKRSELVALHQAFETHYLNGNSAYLIEHHRQLNLISEIVFDAFAVAESTDDLVIGLDVPSDNTLSGYRSISAFFDAVCNFLIDEEKNDYPAAIAHIDVAVSKAEVEKELLEKARNERLKSLEKAVAFATGRVNELIDQEKFLDAVIVVDRHLTLPFNNDQKSVLMALKSRSIEKGRENIYQYAVTLKKKGRQMEALRTIDTARVLGLDSQLRKFYDEIKRDFDYGLIESAEDAEYFVNCPEGMMAYLEQPAKAEKNIYCRAQIDIRQQMGPSECRGYVLPYDKEVLMRLVFPGGSGMALEGKTAWVVFRFAGTETVNRAIGGTSIIPLIEVIYLQ